MQHVELVYEPGPPVPAAPLDPEGIETCLTNLISNGVDAAVMHREGRGKVCVRVADRDGDLVFEVEDNGCGIEGEIREKIFTTFFTTKGGKGTGLGLLTTRRIVQEHGGRMQVESEVGSGSTFRIILPRKRLEMLAARVPPAAAAAGERGHDGVQTNSRRG